MLIVLRLDQEVALVSVYLPLHVPTVVIVSYRC